MASCDDIMRLTDQILDGSHLKSPADLDVNDRQHYQVGACLLTTTLFTDIGLVGVLPNTFPATPKVVEQEEDEEDAFERMDTSALEGFGLPTQFGGQRSRKGSTKRQQPSSGRSLEGGSLAGTPASLLCTIEQLSSPVAASSSAPAAQNLRAAVGAAQAQAEQQPSPTPACNDIAAGNHCAVPSSSAISQAALVSLPQHGDPWEPSDVSGLGLMPGTSKSCVSASAALTLNTIRAAEPIYCSVNIRSQPGSAAPADSSPKSGPDAEQAPSSASSGPDAGDRWHLQGVPSPTGSHVRFESDDDSVSPSVAAELEDSEVIAQLHFVADERGHVVISFSGRSIVEPHEPEQDRMQSHAQAGSRKRDTPTKAPRQWRHHPPNKQQLKALKLSARVAKYWMQRYSLWSRYDEGVRMDEEGWFSATPEVIAMHHAERVAGKVVVDAFCGVGGNAVHFARQCKHVIGIDNCLPRLHLAQQNARVYGVAGRLDLLCADYFDLRDQLKVDAVYMSPPWGGPSYSASTFEVDRDVGGLGCNMHQLLASAFSLLPEGGGAGVILFLPRNTNLKQLSEALPEGAPCEVERAVLNGFLKGITVYIGSLARYVALK